MHGGVRVQTVPTGPVQANAALVTDANGEGFLIDPGDNAETLLRLVEQAGARVRGVLLTHAHFDHIGAVQAVRTALSVPVHLHDDDLPLYRAGATSAGRWGIPFTQPEDPDAAIADGQVFEAGGVRLTARTLPGHAPGHVVFVGDGFVIAGDTLFQGGIGRTDLPGGNHPLLLRELARVLLSLPDDTVVYPGHGPRTTVGAEKASNPFLR